MLMGSNVTSISFSKGRDQGAGLPVGAPGSG